MYSLYQKAEVTFQYIKEIGQEGRNSSAYLAHDKNLDANLVIKEIKKKDIIHPKEFFDESRTLYKSSHPNVVQIQYACECDKNIYIALPYYKNGSVKSLMERRNLTVREIVRFGLHTISALHNIHSKGLIHFDIKPDNILISDRGEALLSDFGLAKHTNEDAVAEQPKMYLKHTAPEYYEQDHFDARYDIYQLGLSLYRMCNGNTDFDNQFFSFVTEGSFDRKKHYDEIKKENFPKREYKEHIPSRLISIIGKCLKPSTEDRYTSALDVANDLSSIEGNLLDWAYSSNEEYELWEKNTETHSYRLRRNHNGQSTAEKKTNRGNWTKIRNYCVDSLSKADTKRFLREF